MKCPVLASFQNAGTVFIAGKKEGLGRGLLRALAVTQQAAVPAPHPTPSLTPTLTVTSGKLPSSSGPENCRKAQARQAQHLFISKSPRTSLRTGLFCFPHHSNRPICFPPNPIP